MNTTDANDINPSPTQSSSPDIFLATRIHLGKQSTPPTHQKLVSIFSTFLQTSQNIGAYKTVVAVDPQEKIKGYDLVSSVQKAISDIGGGCEIISVTPWGNFIPALNALTSWAMMQNQKDNVNSSVILFISAETSITNESIHDMIQHYDYKDTLVVGAALPGHDYKGEGGNNGVNTDLNGRTCPWNTCAIWNLNKLALYGFPLVADGLHIRSGTRVAAGIEEFSTILMHQNISSQSDNKAKLVRVSGVEWEQNFDGDENRKRWHEEKMKSKFTRAEVHRLCLGGNDKKGVVIHY